VMPNIPIKPHNSRAPTHNPLRVLLVAYSWRWPIGLSIPKAF
jgi:hypothetical protein